MIVYTCICRSVDAVFLAESLHPELGGNAGQVMQILMERLVEIPEALASSNRKTFSQRNSDFFGDLVGAMTGDYVMMTEAEHYFHVLYHSEKGIYYSCISDDGDARGQSVNFDYLDGLAHDFEKANFRIKRAKPLSLNKQFLASIRSKMHYYNTNHDKFKRSKKIQNLLETVDDLKKVLDRNITLTLEKNRNQLSQMTAQCEEMQSDTQVFKKRSEVLLQSQKRKRSFRYLFLTLFGLGVVYLLLATSCGFDFSKCAANNNKQESSQGDGDK